MTTMHKQPARLLEEKILVVPARTLFPEKPILGFCSMDSFDAYAALIMAHKQFIPRCDAEQDPFYKQIIPYLIFSYQDKYFLMQRKSTASEQRLRNKYSLGIGGHIREEDITATDIIGWARREFHEEVSYDGSYTILPLGIINDETTEVGRVHTGFAFLLQGDSPAISVRSELKEGNLVPLSLCQESFESLETWTQLLLPHLEHKAAKQCVAGEEI